MMKKQKFNQIKDEYMQTPIPPELDFIVRKTLKESGINMDEIKNKSPRKEIKNSKFTKTAASVAAATMLFTAGVNFSPAVASSLSEIPLVSGIVKVLTFREYKVDEGTYNANIQVPVIKGLENKELKDSLNAQYLADNQKLYDEFMADMADMKKLEAGNPGHLGLDSGYEVKTDTEQLLSIARYVVNTVGSSSTTFKYDTIDKEKELLLTLPSLFKDDSYVSAISQIIKEQMLAANEADENKIYWLKEIIADGMEEFEQIASDQNFYITSDNKLVISFDKYEVAPGYMGVLEFEIPTEEIQDILAGSEYIN